MRHESVAYVSVGANMGDCIATVTRAIADLGQIDGVRLMSSSSLYRTAPIDAGGDDYINAVAKLGTTLGPQELLDQLHSLENVCGRQRSFRNAPRLLDLDLLMFDKLRLDTATLTLPHPRMWQRAFVLVPLHEIGSDLISSVQLESVADQRIARI